MLITIRKHQFAFIIISLLIITTFYFSDQITLESIKDNKRWIKTFIDNHYIFSVLLFFASCLIFVNSPIPFAAVIKVLGGFFFGFYQGLIYNITATTLACLAGFLLSRYIFKDNFEKAYYARLQKVETEIEKNGFYYFLTLRLVMVIPYFSINIIAGISRISFKNYLYSTILGVIPASLIYANGGNKLEQINSISELFKSDVLIALSIIAAFSIIPLLMTTTHFKRDNRSP